MRIFNVLGASIVLDPALLAARPFNFKNSDALDVFSFQRLFDLVEFERFNDGCDFFSSTAPYICFYCFGLFGVAG